MQSSAPNPSGPGPTPAWWQWPTVLSLDAPAVAVGWQWFFGRIAGASINWHHHIILGSAVWLAYAADRWIEGWIVPAEKIRTKRHAFYQRHRWSALVIWLLVLTAAVATAWRWLHPSEFDAGLIVLGPVLLYLLSHQLAHRHHPWRVPKEVCVALLFAAGTSCFILAQDQSLAGPLLAPLTLFAGLGLANCALISVWESEVDREHGQTSLALQHPARARLIHALPWLLAMVSVLYGLLKSTIDWSALTASALLLGLVDLGHHRTGREISRVLADVALLTPLPLWLLSLLP
ncbi:MAG: hypothetical protein R3F03_14685 [Opitutaceae bacterium]